MDDRDELTQVNAVSVHHGESGRNDNMQVVQSVDESRDGKSPPEKFASVKAFVGQVKWEASEGERKFFVANPLGNQEHAQPKENSQHRSPKQPPP